MHKLYSAREVQYTESGSRVAILQDGPSHFHITISNQDKIVYDFFQDLPNIEALRENIRLMENELLTPIPLVESGLDTTE